MAVDLIGLVQPVDPQRGPFLLIVHVVGAHSSRYDVVDLGADGTPAVHSDIGAYRVGLDVNEHRVISMSDTYTDWSGGNEWGNVACRPGEDHPPGDGLFLNHYTRFDFATGEIRAWKRCE